MTSQLLSLQAQLEQGARELGLNLPQTRQQQLLAYVSLLQKWNATYNLTAVRDSQQMLTHHLLDCLAALHAYAGARSVLDVGSGGGLPGLVIAIWASYAAPDMRIELIDTVHKKTAFLTQVKSELRLSNVTVHTGRVEQFTATQGFDIITSRAFAALPDFAKWTSHLLSDGGKLVALKGPQFEAELKALPNDWRIEHTEQLHVPQMAGERYLITLMRANENSR
jgi:16S rRNA (guanine527-N7)-methyltransferase